MKVYLNLKLPGKDRTKILTIRFLDEAKLRLYELQL